MDVIRQAVVINRASRPDRWEQFQRNWNQTGWAGAVPLYRFEAIEGGEHGGAWGCLQSHLGVMREWPTPTLILEDDAVFNEFFPWTLEPPDDWDLLWLGGEHIARPRVGPLGWVQPVEQLHTHAYAVRLPSVVAEVFEATRPARMDPFLARLPLRQYSALPATVGQSAGKSDTGPDRAADIFWSERWPRKSS